MKKLTALVLAVLLIFGLCACSGNSESTDTTGVTSDSTQNGTPLTTPSNAGDDTTLSSVAVKEDVNAEDAKAEAFAALDEFDVELDLTGLNKNMLIAQVQDITNNYKNYIGKTIRITGSYDQSYYDQTDKYYNYLFGYDETGCCAAWAIEFYGDSVPETIEPYTTLSMVGKINAYEELGVEYPFIDVEHIAL